MKYYIKEAIFPFVYVILMSITAIAILAISGLTWLKAVLAVLNLALYAVTVAGVAYKEGQDSIKVQHSNDLERREIIRTGEDRPLKLNEEYKPYKGFLIGFCSCIPLLLLLVLHVITHLLGGSNVFGAIAGMIYFMFYIFFNLNVSAGSGEITEAATVSWYACFGTLIALPIIMSITGVSYILGAKKIKRQQELIKIKQHQIYGDKD